MYTTSSFFHVFLQGGSIALYNMPNYASSVSFGIILQDCTAFRFVPIMRKNILLKNRACFTLSSWQVQRLPNVALHRCSTSGEMPPLEVHLIDPPSSAFQTVDFRLLQAIWKCLSANCLCGIVLCRQENRWSLPLSSMSGPSSARYTAGFFKVADSLSVRLVPCRNTPVNWVIRKVKQNWVQLVLVLHEFFYLN